MAIIHKVIEGGEQYLGWALARERAMRSQGGNRTIKYDLGDAEVEIRVVGSQSFIFMRATGVQVSDEWVAFQLYMQTEFSLSNAVDVTNGPEGTERPKPPTPPVSSDPPPETIPEGPNYDGYTEAYGGSPQADSYKGAVAAQKAARASLIAEMDALGIQKRYLENRDYPASGLWPAVRSPIVYTQNALDTGASEANYNSNYDYFLRYGPAAIADHYAYLAWSQSNQQLLAAYQAALIAYRDGPLDDWEAKNLPSLVCPPYFLDLIGKQRAGRQLQIDRLKAEQAMGMQALPMFNPVMHPQYIPKEQPLVPFHNGAGAWAPSGTYTPMSSSYTEANHSPAVPTCGAVAAGRTYVNGYDTVQMSLERAFGYVVNGTVRSIEASAPPLARITNLDNYDDWLESPRGPGQASVSFDFFHGPQVAEVYFAFFEYEAYDFFCDQWVWTPSLGLLSSSPLISCYSLCYSYPDHEREATYTNRPDHFNGVRTMRSTGFYKQTRNPDGTWSAMKNLGGQPINVDLQPLTSSGAVYGFGLPDGIVALKGLQGWMLPMFPHPQVAVTQEYLGGVTIPSGPSTISSSDEFMHWLYAQCLTRFQIPFQ